MPRLKPGKAPAYRLHKPTGRAVVRLGAKDVYLGRYNTPESRQAYDRVIAEWLARGRQPAVPARATVRQVLDAFKRHARDYYKKRGRITSRGRIAIAISDSLSARFGE